MDDELKRVLERTLAPLIEADGGELYWHPADAQGEPTRVVRLHLGGRFSGCPGNSLVTDRILRPAVAAVLPHAQLEVSSGVLLPPGAERIQGVLLAEPRGAARVSPDAADSGRG